MSNMDVMANLESRMNFVADRQQVLTQNIANADTPGYRAMELQAPTFGQTLNKLQAVQLSGVGAMTLSGTRSSSSVHGTLVTNRNPAEVSPTGNTVSLEDETNRAAQNAMDYQLVTNVYKTMGGMIMKAAGKS